jgi:hypothetical protein
MTWTEGELADDEARAPSQLLRRRERVRIGVTRKARECAAIASR